MKILIYGHSGSGKTTLAKQLAEHYKIPNFNGDDVRKMFNDWHFEINGRKIQAMRMRTLSNMVEDCIVDFICPLNHYRKYYDYTIFMNTKRNFISRRTSNPHWSGSTHCSCGSSAKSISW